MAQTPSTMLALGTQAPDFRLPDATGRHWALADFARADVLVVMFLCNHCPFVKHVAPHLGALGQDYAGKPVALVGINSNDFLSYPEDTPAKMGEHAHRWGFTFPYLVDEKQSVAKAYHAACTPDFFVFDRARRLAYRGQLDGSRPSNGVDVTGADLRGAIDAVLAGKALSADQKPSIGCNIKWRAGNAPAYATA